MEFEKAVIFGIHLTDYGHLKPPYHIFAKVVLLDQTRTALPSVIYELDDQTWQQTSHHYTPDLHNAFVMLGEVKKINRDKKMIILCNGNTITYEYLIIASDSSSKDSPLSKVDFQSGLAALHNALKLKSKQPTDVMKKAKRKVENVKILQEGISFFHLNDALKSSLSTDLELLGRRLFRVQY